MQLAYSKQKNIIVDVYLKNGLKHRTRLNLKLEKIKLVNTFYCFSTTDAFKFFKTCLKTNCRRTLTFWFKTRIIDPIIEISKIRPKTKNK